jgi:hypothetical protein
MEIAWWFGLNAEDARLVLKALGGRLKPDELVIAKELGDRLTLERSKAAATLARQMETNAKHVEDLDGPRKADT